MVVQEKEEEEGGGKRSWGRGEKVVNREFKCGGGGGEEEARRRGADTYLEALESRGLLPRSSLPPAAPRRAGTLKSHLLPAPQSLDRS